MEIRGLDSPEGVGFLQANHILLEQDLLNLGDSLRDPIHIEGVDPLPAANVVWLGRGLLFLSRNRPPPTRNVARG